MIPPLDTTTGRLPFTGTLESSVYHATLSEVADTFVPMGDEPRHRGLIMAALTLWHRRVREVAPSSRLWLSGSFLSTKPKPNDVDVLVLAPDNDTVLDFFGGADPRGLEYFTGQDVHARYYGGPFRRVQPLAGLVDVHLVQAWLPVSVNLWGTWWSTVFDKATNTPTSARMGILEVSL